MNLISAFAYTAFAAVLVWASGADIARRVIPNKAIAAGAALWLVLVAAQCARGGEGGAAFFARGVVGGIAIAGISLVCAFVGDRLSGRESFGGGDVKLLFVMGLFAGLEGVLATLGIACALALMYCGARAVAKRPVRDFPFAPFLTAAFFVVVLAGW